MQVNLPAVFVAAVGCGRTSNFLRLQIVFKFCRSYFFLVSSLCVFCCCGFEQNSEAFAPFGYFGLVLFRLHLFISYRRLQCVCLLVAAFGGQADFLLLLQTVFKFIPGFVVFAFYCSSFGWTV